MYEPIQVIYENGVLRPLGALPTGLREHQQLTVTIHTSDMLEARLDTVCLRAARRETDPAVSLEEVRAILAKVQGSLAQAVVTDREER